MNISKKTLRKLLERVWDARDSWTKLGDNADRETYIASQLAALAGKSNDGDSRGMKWIKASERPPDSYDAHEKHVQLDGKKVDGMLVECENGGLVLEYKEASIYKIEENLNRVEWLDESPALPVADGDKKSHNFSTVANAASVKGQHEDNENIVPDREGEKVIWLNELIDIRNKLYEAISTGNSENWDLLQIIRWHINDIDSFSSRIEKYNRSRPLLPSPVTGGVKDDWSEKLYKQLHHIFHQYSDEWTSYQERETEDLLTAYEKSLSEGQPAQGK